MSEQELKDLVEQEHTVIQAIRFGEEILAQEGEDITRRATIERQIGEFSAQVETLKALLEPIMANEKARSIYLSQRDTLKVEAQKLNKQITEITPIQFAEVNATPQVPEQLALI